MKGMSRVLAVSTAVLALHVAAVWALNAGLRTRPVEVLVSAPLLARLIERPPPAADSPAAPEIPVHAAAPPPPPPPKSVSIPVTVEPRKAIAKSVARPLPQPIPNPVPQTNAKPRSMPVPVLAAVPVPAALPPAVDTTPSPDSAAARNLPDTAPRGDAVAAPSAAATPTFAPAPAPAPALAPLAPPAPMTVELPSSDARYLQNPKPRYPPISARLNEQGTVQIQVLVSDKGVARDARIQSSSGFSRLDNAALTTVLTWRFVPGKRAGVAESMWYTVPIRFGLE